MIEHRIGGIMASEYSKYRVQVQVNNEIYCCCFASKHGILIYADETKDGFLQNQDNVSSWATILSVNCCFSDLAL